MKCASCAPTSRPRRLYFSLAKTTMERPSGVSSARLDNCAASASSASVMPGAGRNATACRLPSVMVPVLSSNKVFTSPDASTAFPLMARTLCCMTRSIPAMPIAESKPPMVVGIRQTSSEINTATLGTLPDPAELTLKAANGCSVTTARRKISVKPAIRIFSAISLGVFCRSAPSTSAIIRSRNVSPGFEVMRISIRSESTLVPPVTALRSPPDSRITGALSPVMTDSSTVAIPSITSPSAGIRSPVWQKTISPARSFEVGTCSVLPPLITRLATASVLVLRSASACALPRASAIASAKFANRTVNHSHSAIWMEKPTPAAPLKISRARKTVVRAAPTSTTNITGFVANVSGFSLISESLAARLTMAGSNSGRARTSRFGIKDIESPVATGGCNVVAISLTPDGERKRGEEPAFAQQEVLDDRPQREGRKERQRSDNHNGANQQTGKQRAVCGKGAAGCRHLFFDSKATRHGQQRNDQQEAADECGKPDGEVVPGRIRVNPGEGAAVVSRGTGVGIEQFGETVRAAIVQVGDESARRIPIAVFGEVRHGADCGKYQNAESHRNQAEQSHFDLLLLDLLAQILRRAAHHQSSDENG